MSYLAKNIKFLRKIKSITSTLLAEETGIPRTTLAGYENNSTEPQVSVAYRIAELFNVPLEYLLYKDLSEMGEDVIAALGEEKRLMPYSKPARVDIGIPLYDLPVSAGLAGFALEGSVYSEVPVGYFPRVSFTDGADGAFPVSGFSMEPTVKNGDIVVVKRLQSIELLDTASVYLLISGGERMIKRYLPHDNDQYIICASDNHASFPLLKKDITAAFRILAVFKPL